MSIYDQNLLSSCVKMLENPNMSSELVKATMIGAIQIIRDRLEAIDSPVLELEISSAEYKKYYHDLFIEHGVEYLKKEILENCNV